MKLIIAAAMMIAVAGGRSALAADISITVTDPDGHPLANAVVTLLPDGSAAPVARAKQAQPHVIDQQHETFIPLVVVLRRGEQVVFRNSDTTHHHAYSFSPIERFELMLEPGEESKPVRFDTPGIAAIGCNIHDQMVAYVYVADTPWSALTDEQGHATIDDVPTGNYDATGWHPRLRPGSSETRQHVTVGPADQALTVAIPVLPEKPAQNRHQQEY